MINCKYSAVNPTNYTEYKYIFAAAVIVIIRDQTILPYVSNSYIISLGHSSVLKVKLVINILFKPLFTLTRSLPYFKMRPLLEDLLLVKEDYIKYQ